MLRRFFNFNKNNDFTGKVFFRILMFVSKWNEIKVLKYDYILVNHSEKNVGCNRMIQADCVLCDYSDTPHLGLKWGYLINFLIH